jgi:hypothetical protein
MKRKTARQKPQTRLTAIFFPVALAFFLTLLHGCAAGPRPLSIKMFNAQTNTTLNCEARDLGRADRDMLADTVETCARQLERSGFARQSSTP